MQDYRKLRVWQRAHLHTLAIQEAVERYFPRRGFHKLRDQLIGAADSIPENIVEGCGAPTRPDFARFLATSIKSANEVEYELLLARDRRVLPADVWRGLSQETVEIRKMLWGLRRAVKNAHAAEQELVREAQARGKRRHQAKRKLYSQTANSPTDDS